MSNPFPSDPFAGMFRMPGGNAGGGRTAGGPGGALWEAFEQLRSSFEQKVGTRMGRGDVRAAILALLAEQPMHGYQIIHEIDARSGGAWKPSPGSVYPTLQMLSDEGLIRAEESNGRKTYVLTDEGRAVAADAAGTSAPWESAGSTSESGRATALPKAGIELAQAAAQVGRTGSAAQVKAAVEVLEDARRKLYSILAQD